MENPTQVIAKTLTLCGPERRWPWIAIVLLAIALAALEAVGALLIVVMMGLIASPETSISLPMFGTLSNIFPDASRETLLLSVAAVIGGFFVFRGFAIFGQAYVRARLVHNASANLASHLVRGYLAMPYIFHTQTNSAELVRNSTESVREFTGRVVTPIAKVIAETVVVVGLLGVLLWTSPLATAFVVAAFLPLTWLLLRVVQPRLKLLGAEAQDSRAGCLKAVQQALGGVRDIQLLSREDHFTRAFKQERRKLARTAYLRESLTEVPRSLIETTLVLIVVALFAIAIIGGDTVEGLLSTLGVFAYAGLRLQPSLRQIVQGVNDIKYGSAVMDDLLKDRRRADEALAVRSRESSRGAGVREFERELRLTNVSFYYEGQSDPALVGVSLGIQKGEFVGICGPTGGGKSTLVDLIAGLIEPTSGEIRLDGNDLREVRHEWWQQLGVVSQNVFLIDDTIRNNIALGRTGRETNERQLELAVQRAQLDEVVATLPHGLDTMVGERGVRLSGGQRQRVAIARAFYRQPSVLVLDEGTSALDTATEAALVDAMEQVKEGRTLVTVAHRISTIREANRLVLVDSGRVVAEGSYRDLVSHSELFHTLVRPHSEQRSRSS